MKTFEEILTEKYLLEEEPTPAFMVRQALDEYLAQFQKKIDEIPTVDGGSIDYRDAQQDLLDKIKKSEGKQE
jgi:hypothetical protein